MLVAGPHCGLRPDSDLGGEVYERMLLTRLPARGVELEIGLPRSRPLERVPSGWRIRLLSPGRGLRWYLAPLAFVPYTLRALRNPSVDLLRGHSIRFTGPSLIVARWLARSSVPIVLHHLHSERRWSGLEAWVLRRADAVITISEHSRRQLLVAGVPNDRIFVVPPGIARPEDSEPWPEAWTGDGGLNLLYLGRLVERKRPELAVQALAHIVSQGTAASLVVAGQGPLRVELAGLAARLGVEQRITWLGAVSERDKWRLYETADVLLFPSALEGFGFVVGEAQAAGLPVVAAEGTAASEIVLDGETGFLVRADPDAFASAVRALDDPHVRANMGRRAREVAARFDWDRSAASVADVYERLLETCQSETTGRKARHGVRVELGSRPSREDA